jgi:hypothetical protein
MYGERDAPRIMEALERNFAVLHNRAHVQLTMCGIVITTTGFSGRLIAGTNFLAQLCVILGVGVTLVSAALVVFYVQHIHWLTQHLGELVRPWLLACIKYRDTKTRYYRWSIFLLLVGLVFYVVAIGIMLMYPTSAPPLGVVR